MYEVCRLRAKEATAARFGTSTKVDCAKTVSSNTCEIIKPILRQSFWWISEKVQRSYPPPLEPLWKDLEVDFESLFFQKLADKISVNEHVSFTKSCYENELGEIRSMVASELPRETSYWRKLSVEARIPS